MKKTIGILGGMGPMATVDLLQKIISNTQAANDNEHIPVCVENNTAIPDRTAAILHGGADPVQEMVRSALRLEYMGADFLLIACNTAHYFLPRVQEMVRVPIVNMPEETAAYLRRQGVDRAGLLATDGTIRSGVYERVLDQYGVRVVMPDEKGQRAVMEQIYQGVKAGDASLSIAPFVETLDDIVARGAQTMIMACTELPFVFARVGGYCTTDPATILARCAVELAGGKLRKACLSVC